MTTATISLRDRRQLTLPAEAVAALGLAINDTLEVRLVGGGILLVPTHAAATPPRPMARFVGAARGLYGQTAKQADAIVRDLRDSW